MRPSKKVMAVRMRGGDATLNELGDIIELWTPQETKDYVMMTMTAFESMQRDVNANSDKLGQGFVDSWNATLNGFMKFVHAYDDAGWIYRSSMGPVRTAERFATILEGYRANFEAATGTAPSQKSVVRPLKEQGEWMAGIGDIGKWVIIGAGVLGGIYLLNTFRNK